MSSPPPLRHPIPTHPAYIPEPPSTPVSPPNYQRYSSSPVPQQSHQHLSHGGHAGMGVGEGVGMSPGGGYMGAGSPGMSTMHGTNSGGYGQYPATNHVPAYTSPFGHGHGMPQPHIHSYSGNMAGPGMGNGMGGSAAAQGGFGSPTPDFSAWGLDGATAQLGMQLGHSAVAAGQEYMQKNFGTLFPSTNLKYHFNVSNSYVMRKLRLVLFPWAHKPWARRVRRTENGQSEWQPPREDINSPDLYIPVMAMVTYILLTALHRGLEKNFNPKILGESASRAIAVVLLDFIFVKLGCYFLNIQGSSQVIDLIAYGGYKFVGVILTIAAGFLGLSGPLWTLVFIYSFLANAFFLLRSLRSVVLPDPSISISTNPNPTTTATVNPTQRRRRIAFLFLEAVCQILYMGVLVRI